jgi:hypothetical protein
LTVAICLDELLATASAAAGGLDDFGPDDHLVGLGILLEAAATSPHAGPALDRRVRATAAVALTSRLLSQAGWAERPESLTVPLAPQVVVIGLPRSGTTALHQILAADPQYQCIPSWLAPRPRPRPPRRLWEKDPEHQARAEEHRVRGPNPLHDIGPDDPEECLQVMQQSLLSMVWVSSLPVPDYHDWFMDQDERPSYRRYADNLRLIGADDPGSPWLLKNPSHTFGMAAMLDEFPDAAFVHIYRDPAETIVSGCSLIASMGLGEGTFTPAELGAHRLRIWSKAAERMDEARRAAGDRTFIDVDYRAFVADPVATVAEVYRGLGRPLGAQPLGAMRRWVAERPKDRLGRHTYRAEDFGLNGGAIRERMAGYIERYGTSPATDAEV